MLDRQIAIFILPIKLIYTHAHTEREFYVQNHFQTNALNNSDAAGAERRDGRTRRDNSYSIYVNLFDFQKYLSLYNICVSFRRSRIMIDFKWSNKCATRHVTH